MMKNMARKVIMVLIFAGVFGFGAYAFAGWGMGYGHHGWRDNGSGWHHRGGFGYGSGSDYTGNLSGDEIEKLEQYRAEYFKATEDIRQKLYEKELELRSELAKKNPDTGKASKLQSEISKLQGQLDQKSLDYEMKARKATPSYRRGYREYGPMMGYGSRGGGNCMWQS